MEFFKDLFIYSIFLAVVSLFCCTQALSNGGEQGLLFVAVRGLLIAVDVFCCRAQLPGARASVAAA